MSEWQPIEIEVFDVELNLSLRVSLDDIAYISVPSEENGRVTVIHLENEQMDDITLGPEAFPYLLDLVAKRNRANWKRCA